MFTRMLRTMSSVMQFGPLELDPVTRRLARCANVDDLRRIAKRRLPGGVFDYIDGAAEDEVTMRRNAEAYTSAELSPRVLCDVSNIDTSTTLLGERLPFPLALAPTGFTRIAHPDGELAVARAAAERSVPYTLSTVATRSIEEVAAAAPDGRNWFQLYVGYDRGLSRELVGRAGAAGYKAIMVTVDTAVLGRRERDVRRGFTLPPKIGLGTLADGAVHPGWSWAFVRSEPITFANLTGDPSRDGSTAVKLADYATQQFDPCLSWHDIEWIKSLTDLPVIVKGIQSVDDAKTAASIGIDAIVLSNHGGRQLDGGPSTLSLVAPVTDAVGDSIEVLCDGGVRRGRDIVIACALGARACLVGRPYLYGLAAGGQRGVTHVLDLLHDGVRRTMALTGSTSIETLDAGVVGRH